MQGQTESFACLAFFFLIISKKLAYVIASFDGLTEHFPERKKSSPLSSLSVGSLGNLVRLYSWKIKIFRR
ncbi:hypothetical protein HMPREF1557_02112 [Streptococcus sobrinus W1703]|uniref:Uncharacterized protein n=1 Tax=Streptococcus sobrinus W1703 TaxID=1227275 RepID=U2J231_9STRE|nr:hypothetical protein HMPREF1557_02112 [Streptococcus sobrinus W1703]